MVVVEERADDDDADDDNDGHHHHHHQLLQHRYFELPVLLPITVVRPVAPTALDK